MKETPTYSYQATAPPAKQLTGLLHGKQSFDSLVSVCPTYLPYALGRSGLCQMMSVRTEGEPEQ